MAPHANGHQLQTFSAHSAVLEALEALDQKDQHLSAQEQWQLIASHQMDDTLKEAGKLAGVWFKRVYVKRRLSRLDGYLCAVDSLPQSAMFWRAFSLTIKQTDKTWFSDAFSS